MTTPLIPQSDFNEITQTAKSLSTAETIAAAQYFCTHSLFANSECHPSAVCI